MVEGALPGELGGGFVEARCGVVVKALIGIGVDVGFVLDVVHLERFVVAWPRGVDPRIFLGEM